ncbi:transglycosylase SLT domain-containing protein [Skermanella pratensis]|uniref:transglycosylase SLT domain-containing protein n=1 Tax=Skermanella pratensis TaxID=2233999 RepID=UPI00178819A0|nr:transglycosylase SLT domain-containing protein [Skermanella pratensis]
MSNPANLMHASDPQQYRAAAGAAPQAIQAAVRQASDRTGVDFSYLMAKAAQESSFDPAAKAATSSATGLYQFIESTWLNMVEQHGAKYGLGREAAQVQRRSDGTPYVQDPQARRDILDLRKDPKVSSYLAAEFARDNQTQLEQTVGGRIGSTELYMAHFLGAGGASRFLNGMRQNPDQPAAALLPEAAAANRGVFYDKSGKALSVGQIYDRFAAKFDGMEGSSVAASAGAIGTPSSRSAWSSDGGFRSPFGRATAPNAEPASLFTVMVLSQLGTPKEDGAAADGSKNGQREAAKAISAPMPGFGAV